ncbi:putative Guanine nucleotide-binding protein alpha-1 subunit [Paratrimastix pyriformis]|uniref:Guanine nucleotide-binding protein alpha-1 subunit n=1 Tax=Paratrimastix pyriformis TaxID=342808 RepID=A0ABQ8URP4_9EUKA|nr:putative Guanine nucleotide-binding protein alpha-1 subunit [Paratrimastix pyriformis]
MGCGQSTESNNEDGVLKQQSSQIDEALRKERLADQQEQKLILLGAGESGKSTIFKQLKLIHGGGYSARERESFKVIIFSNCIQSMKAMLLAAERFRIPIVVEENKPRCQRIMSLLSADEFNADIAQDMHALWQDPGIQATFARKSEFQLHDNCQYFFNQILQLGAPDYSPTIDDVLHSRVQTSGIREMPFTFGGLRFRGHGPDLLHVPLRVLVEDETTNRMQESLLLFEELCNCKWFRDTSIILFLNKLDLFIDKIKAGADLRVCFPEYRGGNNIDAAKAFIRDRFVELNQSENKQIYPHETCATDTQNIKFVFDAVKDIILQINLRGSGFF